MRAFVTLCAAGALASLAGCSGSSSPVASAPTSVTTTPPSPSASPSAAESVTPTAAASPTTTPSLSPTPSASSAAVVASCVTSSLRLQAVAGGAAAGTDYISLVVTNIGSSPCTLLGYPGASFLDSHGRQVGLPAKRDRTSPPHRVVVKPGEKAHAVLSYPNPGVYASGCGGTDTTGVRFYPPDQTESLEARVDANVCTDRKGRSSIGSMRPGTRGF